MMQHVVSAVSAYMDSLLGWCCQTTSSSYASSSGSRGRSVFQWGASISALFVLILNQIGRRSGFQASLLVLFLVISFPTVLFNILRGQFGYWVAFIAVVANLSFPHIFPVSRFLFFIITPDWLADELRYSITGGVICLALGITIVISEIHAAGGFSCVCSCHCLAYWLSMLLLFFFTVLYLSLGPW